MLYSKLCKMYCNGSYIIIKVMYLAVLYANESLLFEKKNYWYHDYNIRVFFDWELKV